MHCPHCTQPVFRPNSSRTKLKARTSMLVLHKGGDVEINCGSCGRGVLVPLAIKEDSSALQKSTSVRLVVPKT
jgi:hypothetical protein